MLSAHFAGKQSMDPVDLTSTCHPSPSLTTFVFRSQEVNRLLLDLDWIYISTGSTSRLDLHVLFILFFSEMYNKKLLFITG